MKKEMQAPRPKVQLVPPRETKPPELDPGDDAGDPKMISLARAGRFLRRLVEAEYFGRVTFRVQAGKIVEVQTDQTMKIDEL
jgi:hypothetical protein